VDIATSFHASLSPEDNRIAIIPTTHSLTSKQDDRANQQYCDAKHSSGTLILAKT